MIRYPTLNDNRNSSNLPNLTTITKYILASHLNLRLRQRYPLINQNFQIEGSSTPSDYATVTVTLTGGTFDL